MLFQAQKRKLGLLEDDDVSMSAATADAKGQNFREGWSTAFGKNWGMSIHD